MKAFLPWILKPLYQQSSESQRLEATKNVSDSLSVIVKDTVTPLLPFVSHTTAFYMGKKSLPTVFLTSLEHKHPEGSC